MVQKEKTDPRKKSPMPKTLAHPSSTQRKLTRMDQASIEQSISATDKHLAEGKRVIHERFGVGIIIEISGEGNDKKATVKFDNAGEKKLLLKFAKLRRLG